MSFELVDWLGLAAGIHATCGLAFGLVFATRLAGRIDPDARRGTWGFKLAILPGLLVLWPCFVVRLARGGEPREDVRRSEAPEEGR